MKGRYHLLFIFSLIIVRCNCNDLCGEEYGCWSVPPGCVGSECSSSVRWTVNGTALRLRVDASMDDVPHINSGAYVAIGFSHDTRMGEDTVIECVYDGREELRPFVSYNDGLHNAQLHAATDLLISDVNATLFEGKMLCDIELDFEQRQMLSATDKLKVYDVISQPLYLQVARGTADPYTFAKKKHSLWDGSLYPWTSSRPIVLMPGLYGYDSVDHAFQSATLISRNLTYVLVTLHSLMMLWGWWFLASNAILIARYCKLSWPKTSLCGAAVWFQVHRNFMVLSVALQVTAFLFIVTQAGFSFYLWCTMQCTMEHFSKPAHTWSGLIAFGLAVVQPFFAWIRPSGISKCRRLFNCMHWFIGMTSFIVASVSMIFAIPLGKTALAKHYAKLPNLLMGSYLVLFTATSIIMEILVSLTVSTNKREMSTASVIYTKVPNEERPTRKRHLVLNRRVRVLVLLLHAAGSVLICSRLSGMLIDNYFRSH